MIMATEAIKLIVGIGEPLVGRLMLYDSLRMSFRDVKIRKDPECDLCGDNPTIHELIDYEAFCSVELPGAAREQPAEQEAFDPAQWEVTAQQLKERIDARQPMTLLDVREPHEYEINRIDGARLTPLSSFESYISELDPSEDIYLYCYKGKRSMNALQQLKERGFKNLHSLQGGIDKWAEEVEPEMPRY